MSKRKLTTRQSASAKRQQQRHLQRAQAGFMPEQESMLGTAQHGLLVALFGVEAEVEADDGNRYRCNLRQNLGVIVVGDRVLLRAASAGYAVIEAILPRKSFLSRPVKGNKLKAVAANIDQVFIVIAPQPKIAVNLLDSYLVAIETLKLSAVIVFNKIDLLSAVQKDEFNTWLAIYRQLNYPVIEVSAINQQGLSALHQQLQNNVSIFVGQSGVGKSSLLRNLLPVPEIKIGETTAHMHGLHTTTTARLYHLLTGGDIIDSPGIRDFILWDMTPVQIARGFVEFREFLTQCKFRDCDHKNIQGCALQQAVQANKIAPQRFISFQRILEFLGNVKR